MTIKDASRLKVGSLIWCVSPLGGPTRYVWHGGLFRRGSVWYGVVERDGKKKAKAISSVQVELVP